MSTTQTLVIGGTSGVGLDVARRRAAYGQVMITGHYIPIVSESLDFIPLELGDITTLSTTVTAFVANLPEVDCLVYAAGFYQEGALGSLGTHAIDQMVSVTTLAPALIINALLERQGHLNQLVLIGSSSGYTPRPLEPIYCLGKAGYPILAKLLALGNQVTTALVVEPSGIKTSFWRDYPNKIAPDFLKPEWVGSQIVAHLNDSAARGKSFTHIRLLKGKSGQGPQIQTVE